MSARASRLSARRGFTLLEVVIAMAILGMALMAIFDLNAGAVSSHAYTKKLTVATMLARSKMVDVEQKLFDEGLPSDDDEESGDFSAEGWPQYKWRARILAPRTQNVSPDQFMAAVFNVPAGGDIGALFGGGAGTDPAGAPSPTSGTNPLAAAAGPLAGLAQTQFNQMIDQIGQTVREVHVTVAWKDGTQTETIDVVTHVVSLGKGGDRNGTGGGVAGSGGTGSQTGGQQWVNSRTGRLVLNASPGPNGSPIDPADPTAPLMSLEQWQAQNPGKQPLPPAFPGGGFDRSKIRDEPEMIPKIPGVNP